MRSLSPPDRAWSRRRFLETAALVGCGIASGCRPAADPPSLRAILAPLGARCRAVDAGLAAPATRAALCQRLGVQAVEPERWGPSEWNAMADAVRRDFELGSVVIVDGWVLARAEAVVAAACGV